MFKILCAVKFNLLLGLGIWALITSHRTFANRCWFSGWHEIALVKNDTVAPSINDLWVALITWKDNMSPSMNIWSSNLGINKVKLFFITCNCWPMNGYIFKFTLLVTWISEFYQFRIFTFWVWVAPSKDACVCVVWGGGVLHSKAKRAGQNTLPSGPPIQSFITASCANSDRKSSTAATRSGVNSKLPSLDDFVHSGWTLSPKARQTRTIYQYYCSRFSKIKLELINENVTH